MLFKDISFLELWLPLCAILVACIMRNNSVKIFGFRPVVQEEMLFRDISYLELWQPFCSVEWNHIMCNFGRGYYEEQFCDIFFNIDQWLSKKCEIL